MSSLDEDDDEDDEEEFEEADSDGDEMRARGDPESADMFRSLLVFGFWRTTGEFGAVDASSSSPSSMYGNWPPRPPPREMLMDVDISLMSRATITRLRKWMRFSRQPQFSR